MSTPEQTTETVDATVVWSVNLSGVTFPENVVSTEQKQEYILQLAQNMFDEYGPEKPIIHECSDEDLIE